MANCHCQKCNKDMDEANFYTYRDGRKLELCKKCLTMFIDNFDESTYLWILEKLDIPYIPSEWNNLRDKAYAKDPRKVNGTSVIGKYISKMKLKQWNKYHWEDTEALRAEDEKKTQQFLEEHPELEEEQRRAQALYEAGAMSEAQYRTIISTETYNTKEASKNPYMDGFYGVDNPFASGFGGDGLDIPDPASDLTKEDKIYLSMKWGNTYKANEWIELEKKYNEMCESFDIQDSDTTGTLILICKTYLKMNQAIDIGDVDGYQKLSRTYNELRKSAKFTAAQNKQEKGEFVDSVGQMVAYCEKEGGQIPRFKIEYPLDIVDKVIADLKEYTRDLIYEDTALSRQIEEYLQNRANAEAKKRDEAAAKAAGLDNVEVTDEDILAHKEMIAEQKALDEEDNE